MNWTTRSIQTAADLANFLEVHQDYLSDDRILPIVESIPESLRENLIAAYLKEMACYHRQFREPEGKRDWQGIFDRLRPLMRQLDSRSREHLLLYFYVPDYMFLAARNAGMPKTALQVFCHQAMKGAELGPEPVRSQLRGFIHFNWARTLALHLVPPQETNAKRTARLEEAFGFFRDAAVSRINFYKSVKNGGGDPDRLKNAATQVWRCREDFPKLFPDRPLSDCPVSAALHAETAPLADPQFRLKL